MAESFVKSFKRDYVYLADLPPTCSAICLDGLTILQNFAHRAGFRVSAA